MKKEKVEKQPKKNILVYFILILGLLLIYSRYIEPYNLTLKEYKIESSNIPKSFDSLKIVHFSDIHYGRTVDFEYLKEIVKKINNHTPDLVIFTGDFIDKDIKLTTKEINKINKELMKIDSTLGNFSVVGNHDMKYLNDYKKICDNAFTILDNQEKILYYNENEFIKLIGLADSLESKIDYSLLNKENTDYTFVLVHEPDEFDKISEFSFNVMLSGHSHNGQVRAPFIGKIYTPIGSKEYFDRYYNIDGKELFISNGIGTSGLPFRFMSKPSINLYRLYSI